MSLNKYLNGFLAFICASLPLTIVWILVKTHAQIGLFDLVPSLNPVLNDTIINWHTVSTFKAVNFSGGYYTFNEYPALSPYFHFYAWGPLYPLFYGLLAKFTGWTHYTAVFLNAVWIGVSILIFVWLTRLNTKRLLLLALLISTFWPIVLFLPFDMQESIHYGFAFVFAGLFYRLFSTIETPTWYFKGIFLILLLLAATFRVTWALLLIPFCVFSIENRNWRSLCVALSTAGILIITLFFLSKYLNAPYPNALYQVIQAFQESLYDGWQLLMRRISTQIGYIPLGNTLEIGQRYLIGFVFVFAILTSSIPYLRRYYYDNSLITACSRIEWMFHCVNLGLVAFLIILLYDVFNWRDYRVLAPHLLLAVLFLLVYQNRLWFIVTVAASYALFFPLVIAFYADSLTVYTPRQRQDFDRLQVQLSQAMPYQANAAPWCNTALWIGGGAFPNQLTAIPPGIGISFFLPAADMILRAPLKSKYLLVAHYMMTDPLFKEINTQFLTVTPLGNILLNLDSGC